MVKHIDVPNKKSETPLDLIAEKEKKEWLQALDKQKFHWLPTPTKNEDKADAEMTQLQKQKEELEKLRKQIKSIIDELGRTAKTNKEKLLTTSVMGSHVN